MPLSSTLSLTVDCQSFEMCKVIIGTSACSFIIESKYIFFEKQCIDGTTRETPMVISDPDSEGDINHNEVSHAC